MPPDTGLGEAQGERGHPHQAESTFHKQTDRQTEWNSIICDPWHELRHAPKFMPGITDNGVYPNPSTTTCPPSITFMICAILHTRVHHVCV